MGMSQKRIQELIATSSVIFALDPEIERLKRAFLVMGKVGMFNRV
jgi:hypothetical protein